MGSLSKHKLAYQTLRQDSSLTAFDESLLFCKPARHMHSPDFRQIGDLTSGHPRFDCDEHAVRLRSLFNETDDACTVIVVFSLYTREVIQRSLSRKNVTVSPII